MQRVKVEVERLVAVHSTACEVDLSLGEDDAVAREYAFLVGPSARPPDGPEDIERGMSGGRG